MTRHLVHFSGKTELQKWLVLGQVDFAEVFRGFGEATIRVREAGCSASEGFDKYAITYERCWHLDVHRDQSDCAWLLVYALRPKITHCGTPCTKMCKIGPREVDRATEAQNEFTWQIADHQQAERLGVSVENPKGSLLYKQAKYVKSFGTPGDPRPGWSFYMSDGCQLQVVCDGRADYQRPMLKQATWLANFDLSGMELHCRTPNALAGASHEHKQIRGSMYVEGEGSCSVAQASGRYSPA